VFDLEYLGVEKDFPEQIHHYLTERRETNKRVISRRKREYNQSHSKRRIIIEPTICRLKKFRILAMYLETN
jgi:hypothetical protein